MKTLDFWGGFAWFVIFGTLGVTFFATSVFFGIDAFKAMPNIIACQFEFDCIKYQIDEVILPSFMVLACLMVGVLMMVMAFGPFSGKSEGEKSENKTEPVKPG